MGCKASKNSATDAVEPCPGNVKKCESETPPVRIDPNLDAEENPNAVFSDEVQPETVAAETPACLFKYLSGSTWVWCHDGRKRNGCIEFKSNGSTQSFSNSQWTVTGINEVTIKDVGGAGQHKLYFNEKRTGFFCSQRGQRGYIESAKEGQQKFSFGSPDAAGAPTAVVVQPGHRLNLTINGMSGHLCTIQADTSWTVAQLKSAVDKAAGIPAQQQKLSSAGVVLGNKELLHEIPNMNENGEILLVRVPVPDLSCLGGTSWAWCHNGRKRNGVIAFKSNGSTQSFSNSQWTVTGTNEVTVKDVGRCGVHKLYFNEKRTGFLCSQRGQRGYIETASDGQEKFLFHSPDEADAPNRDELASLTD